MTLQLTNELAVIVILSLLPCILGVGVIVCHLAFQDPAVLRLLAKLHSTS